MKEEELLNTEVEKDETPNEIVEIKDSEMEKTEVFDFEHTTTNKVVNKQKKPKKKLSKKAIIIICACSAIFLIVLIVVLLFAFGVFGKDDGNDEESQEKPKPMVIVEKDNYRYEDGTLIFVSDDKKDLGTYECEHKNDDLCYVAYYSDEDDFDVPKYVYSNGIKVENRSDIINNRYVLIYDNEGINNGLIKLYDIEKKEVLGTYKLAKELSDTSYILKDEKDKYGVIDFSDGENNKIDFKYDFLGYILDSQKIVALENLNYYLLDFEGNELTKKIPGEIKKFDDKYISVYIDNNYYLYDYSGKRVKDAEYDYIYFQDGYVVTAINRRLYFFDDKLNPLNLNGLKINTSNYNTKITFDENKEEINREEAFEMVSHRGSIELNFNDEVKVINIYEGEYSSNLKFINYFDGVLYIYKDANKTNLLGSYTCNNPNVITSDTKNLANCYIANESILLNRVDDPGEAGYLPIYNNRFVFVKDGSGTINLWDLKTNERKGTYSEVDAGYYNNSNDINFIDTANILVMAKSIKSNSYGIIRIENSTLTGIVPFENKKIYYLNNEFITIKNDDTYHIYSASENKELTGNNLEIKNEIIDFNAKYLLVKLGDTYAVYEMNGKIVTTEKELIHVKLYDNFFIGIDKDKYINVYKYDGTYDEEVVDNQIIVNDLAKAYNVRVNGNTVSVNILDETGAVISGFTVVI